MYLKTSEMEFRGVSERISRKTQNTYKIINFDEVSTGERVEVFAGDGFAELCASKRGDVYNLVFNRNKYGSLDLVAFEKVEG